MPAGRDNPGSISKSDAGAGHKTSPNVTECQGQCFDAGCRDVSGGDKVIPGKKVDG